MLESNAVSVIAIVVCGVAAVTDLRSGLIPNWLTFPVIVGAPLVHGWLSGPGALLRSLLALLLCGLVPYLMFRRGGMGGGDVKLFAALGALVGLGLGLQVQLVSMLLACFWGLGVLAFRGQLFAVLRRSLQLMLGNVLPRKWHASTEHKHFAQVRLGAPIAVAAITCVIAEHVATIGWLP